VTSPIKVEIKNVGAVNKAIAKYGQDLETKINRIVQAIATNAMSDVKKRVQGPPKTGLVYTRGNITHQSSAPKEAPATDTGALASSIFYKQTSRMNATIGSRLDYAYYLEFGTLRIKPRPSWQLAAAIAQAQLNAAIQSAIKKAAAK
jgi:hypothetical protein